MRFFQTLRMVLLVAGLAVPPGVFADGLYFGIGLGQSESDPEDVLPGLDEYVDYINENGGSASLDSEGSSRKIFIGSQLNPSFAFEGGMLDMGEVLNLEASASYFDFLGDGITESSTDTVEVDGIYFALIGKAPLSERVSFNGRFGFYNWDAEYKGTYTYEDPFFTDTENYSESYNGNDMFYGISLDIGILSIQYERFTFKDGDIDTEIDNLGIALKFGS